MSRSALPVFAQILSSRFAMGLVAASALLGTSCSDPVYDAQIEALGDVPNPPEGSGQTHRPGQPCVLCHQSSGPASSKPFIIAGTVFESSAVSSAGAAGVQILIVDSENRGPTSSVVTDSLGNFYINQGNWSGEPAFPMKVAIYRTDASNAMATHISREPSCSGCHRNPKDAKPDYRGTVPQVYLKK